METIETQEIYKQTISADEGYKFINSNNILWDSVFPVKVYHPFINDDRTTLTFYTSSLVNVYDPFISMTLKSLMEPINHSQELLKEKHKETDDSESVNKPNGMRNHWKPIDVVREAYNEMLCAYNVQTKEFWTNHGDAAVWFNVIMPWADLAESRGWIYLHRFQTEEVNGVLKPKLGSYVWLPANGYIHMYIYRHTDEMFLGWTGKWTSDIRIARKFVFNTETETLSDHDMYIYEAVVEDDEDIDLVSKESLEHDKTISVWEYLKPIPYFIKLEIGDCNEAVLINPPSDKYTIDDWYFYVNAFKSGEVPFAIALKFTDKEDKYWYSDVNFWKDYFLGLGKFNNVGKLVIKLVPTRGDLTLEKVLNVYDSNEEKSFPEFIVLLRNNVTQHEYVLVAEPTIEFGGPSITHQWKSGDIFTKGNIFRTKNKFKDVTFWRDYFANYKNEFPAGDYDILIIDKDTKTVTNEVHGVFVSRDAAVTLSDLDNLNLVELS